MATKFSDYALHPHLLKTLEILGYKEPTEVQQQVLAEALGGKDLQVSAETGSGKTLAYLIPLFHRLLEPTAPETGSRALILLPTRELAQQIFKECGRLERFTKTRSVLVTGGQEMRYQASLLRRDPDIIVATPGRLIEHLARKNANLGDIELLILDEADRMLDMGFRVDVNAIIDQCNSKRQTMLLSATLNHNGVSAVAKDILDGPLVLDMAGAQTPHEDIEQKIILSDDFGHKCKQLIWLLGNLVFDKAVVFCNKRTNVSELNSFLRKNDIRCNELHGEIPQDERKHIMSQFKQGNFNVLIATDVAARGLDIKGLQLVINFDMAQSGDEYVHRIGRTGRGGEKGTAISLIADIEWNLAAGIQRYLRQEFSQDSIKGLEGKYKGPKKLKKSGKAAGKKQKKSSAGPGKAKSQGKVRHRDRKNIGKRRSSNEANASENISNAQRSGLAPPTRKK